MISVCSPCSEFAYWFTSAAEAVEAVADIEISPNMYSEPDSGACLPTTESRSGEAKLSTAFEASPKALSITKPSPWDPSVVGGGPKPPGLVGALSP